MLDFSMALRALKNGQMVTREGWNGKGMWLALQRPDPASKMTLPYIYMRTAQGDYVPWLASQTDLLAEDWHIPPGQQLPQSATDTAVRIIDDAAKEIVDMAKAEGQDAEKIAALGPVIDHVKRKLDAAGLPPSDHVGEWLLRSVERQMAARHG